MSVSRRVRRRPATDQVVLSTVLIVFAALGVCLAVATVLTAGVGWDAYFDLDTGLAFLALPAGSTFADVLKFTPKQDVLNGPLRFQVGRFLVDALGVQPGMSTESVTSYQVMGAVTLGCSFVALVFLVVSLWRLSGKWTPGIIGATLTLVMPLWIGISGIAWRDIPVAAGLTAISAGLIVLMRGRNQPRYYTFAVLMLVIGIVMAVGTRAGSVLLVLALVVLSLPAVYAAMGTWRERLGAAGVALVATTLGLVASIASHPAGRIDPVEWIRLTVSLAIDRPNYTLVKVMAQDVVSNQLPWWYVPAYVTAQLPLLTLALVVVAAGLVLTWRKRLFGSTNRLHVVARVWPLLVQALVLPIVLIALGVNIYDGIRHVLFIIPALFALVGLVYGRILQLATNRRVRVGVVAAICLTTAASLFAAIRWFPYSYAFVNPVAGIVKEPRIWELDYWGLSVREGAQRLRELGALEVSAIPSANSAFPWDVTEGDLSKPRGATYVFRRWNAVLPLQCTAAFEIKRDGHTLGVGGFCPATSPASGSEMPGERGNDTQ